MFCSLLKTVLKPVPAQTFIRQVMWKTCWAYVELLQNELKSNTLFTTGTRTDFVKSFNFVEYNILTARAFKIYVVLFLIQARQVYTTVNISKTFMLGYLLTLFRNFRKSYEKIPKCVFARKVIKEQRKLYSRLLR